MSVDTTELREYVSSNRQLTKPQVFELLGLWEDAVVRAYTDSPETYHELLSNHLETVVFRITRSVYPNITNDLDDVNWDLVTSITNKYPASRSLPELEEHGFTDSPVGIVTSSIVATAAINEHVRNGFESLPKHGFEHLFDVTKNLEDTLIGDVREGTEEILENARVIGVYSGHPEINVIDRFIELVHKHDIHSPVSGAVTYSLYVNPDETLSLIERLLEYDNYENKNLAFPLNAAYSGHEGGSPPNVSTERMPNAARISNETTRHVLDVVQQHVPIDELETWNKSNYELDFTA